MKTFLSRGRESLHATVKQAIDQADPIGLLDMGCPDDEYNPEIGQVMAYVTAYSDPVLLGERIHQTFVKMFDESIAGPLDVYHRIARQILEGWEGEELLMTDHHLPANSAWLFPEYDFDTMDLECHRSVIIERILERGTWEQLRWLFVTYGEASVAEWVWRHGFRLLSSRSFALWRLALGVTDYVAPEWAVEAKRREPW